MQANTRQDARQNEGGRDDRTEKEGEEEIGMGEGEDLFVGRVNGGGNVV